MDSALFYMAQTLVDNMTHQKRTLVTAESCTGGLISSAITRIPGASRVLERGFTTYSNQSKMDILDVPADILNTHGAVSAQTAEHMVIGALKNSAANIAISVTGIAGPDGGSAEKPVGLVYFGLLESEKPAISTKHIFSGTRTEIQDQAALFGVNFLNEYIIKND